MDELALLAAIRAHPEEDTPRLAYADWLLEQSDSARNDRGQFILTQFRLANDALTPAERAQLLAREKALLEQYREAWTAGLLGDRWCSFHLGFPDRLTIGARDFIDLFSAVAAFGPVVRLHLTQLTVELAELIASDERLASIPQLDLCGKHLTSDVLRTLLGSPHLARLTYLNLSGNPFGNAGAELLAALPVLKRLRYLSVANTGLTEGGVSRLISALTDGGPPNLRWLNLRNNTLVRGNWADTVLARLPPRTPAELRMSLEGQLGRYRLAPVPSQPTPFERLKAERQKLPEQLRFWVNLLEDIDQERLASAVRGHALPPEVHRALAALCVRRLSWWDRTVEQSCRRHQIPKKMTLPEAPPDVATNRSALADLIIATNAGFHTKKKVEWLRDWLLRFYEQHLNGTLDPEGRTR